MSPEKQKIAIAEICGWKPVDFEDSQAGPAWEKEGETTPEGFDWHWLNELPNYPASLDAMHKAEKTAGAKYPDFWVLYLDAGIGSLPEVCQRDDHPVECATAAQRAEAFLKTFNRWEDGE